MRQFTQEGMFNELSKVTRAINKKKYEKMDLPKFANGGPDEPSTTPVDKDKDYYTRMANSPLFLERYARMVGKPLEEVKDEAEAYRQQILNNIETVKINDVGVFPKGVRRSDMEFIDGVYYAPLKKEDIDRAYQHANDLPRLFRKGFLRRINKEIQNYPDHQLFLYQDDPWVKTHELSHGSVKGQMENMNVNEYNFKDMSDDLPRTRRYYEGREEYLTDPNEQKARVDVARKYLESKGLYDPVNEPFTEKHYKLLQDEIIKKVMKIGENQGFKTGYDPNLPNDIEEIVNPYEEKTVIDMFNNFVSNDKKQDLQQGRLGGLAKFIDGGEPEYTFDGRPDSRYKKVNGQWHIKNSSTNNAFVPINDPTGKRTNILNTQAKLVVNDRPQLAPFNNALLTSGKTPQQFYIEQNQNSPELAKQSLVNKYKAEEAARLAELKRKQEEERYLASIPKGPVSDNTRTVIPDIAVQAINNKPAVDAAIENQKKEQAKFESESWEDYEKRSLGEKALDRTKAFMVDPFGMTSRFLMGEQAYFPGMGEGLLNHDSEYYDNYLKALGYTPGEFEAYDISTMINPMHWGASAGNQLRKGNYGQGALETALAIAPFLPKGMTNASNIKYGTKLLGNDFRTIGNRFKGLLPEEKLLTSEENLIDNLGNLSEAASANYKPYQGFIDYENINGLDELRKSLHGTGYTVKPTWGYYTPEELAARDFNHTFSIKQDSWPIETPKNLQSRDVQKEFFDQGDEFASKWYKKNPEAYDDAVQRLSNEHKKNLNHILSRDEMQVWNEVETMKQRLRDDFFAKNNVSSNDYWTAKLNGGDLANFVDDQINGRYYELIKNNKSDIARNAEYEKVFTKLNEHELAKDKLRQEIVDNLDPDFKRKVEGLYELSGKPHPSLDEWTKSIVPTKKHLLHYGDESNVNALSLEAKNYLKDNVNNIGGVRLGTGETLTVGSKPSVTENPTFFIEPDRGGPIFTGNKKVRKYPVKLSDPSTWGNIFEKKVLVPQYKTPRIYDSERLLVEIENQMMNDPQYISEVAAHEEGHTQQQIAKWASLMQDYDSNFKYYTNHERNELAKAYKDAMVEPKLPGTSSYQVGDYDYETWKSGVGELHSELNKSRLNAAQDYMKQGYTMDEAIQILKNLEAEGNDELYEYYIKASGDLDKHFKPGVDFKTKKTLLQILPMVGATVLTGKALFNNEASPLPKQQRFGGNISNLQKFLR